MRLAILTSRVRVEEKLLVEALRRRNVEFDIIDDGELLFDLASPDQRWQQKAIALRRLPAPNRVVTAFGHQRKSIR